MDETLSPCFEEVALPLVEHVLRGFNATCFAYGQTGSGKTHTMFGPTGADHQSEDRGLAYRTTEAIFDEMEQLEKDKRPGLTCKVSFCELYLDQIRDLARPRTLKI